MQFSLATWNINSIRSRMHLLKRFVDQHQPDILCLQETKCADELFPLDAVKSLGFDHVEIKGQKAYHGVATFSKLPIERADSRCFNGTGEARHLAVRIAPGLPGIDDGPPLVLHNFYVPAGGDVPDIAVNPKFGQKLNYISQMTDWCSGMETKPENRMILVGDLNVAPLETDVWSHRQLLKVVSHTPIEVEHFNRLQAAHDWVDVMRLHVPAEERLFTWWSYRARDWRLSNRGRRLDHIWVTQPLSATARSMRVVDEARGWERPSDHAPVLVTFDLHRR